MATPGSEVRFRTSATKRRGPSHSWTSFSVRAHLLGLALGDAARRLPAHGRELTLELPHARLSRVLADDRPQALVGERELRALEPVRLQLLRDEVLLGDPELLFLGVAGELDHVHPVEERRRDGLQLVRRADEEDLREVEGKVEVVVAEGRVLLGVEHLEHCAGRIAAPVRAHLVDLVDQEDRVDRLRVAQGADDRSGHGPDVRAPVAADLGLVADAADRDPDELAPEGLRDRLAEGRLPDPGRPHEAEDRAREVALLELRDREVLDDPLLDLVQVEVVGVEHLARLLEVEVVIRLLVPGEAEDPLEVGADDAVLGRGGREPLEASELAVDRLARLFGQLHLVRTVAELIDLRLLRVALAELLLDRLQLLAQEVLALRGLHLGGDLVLDLRAELRDLELAVEDDEHRAQALLDHLLLEQLLLLLGLQAQRRRDEVAERARILDVRGGERELLRQVGHEADQAREERLHVLGERLGLGCLLVDVLDLEEPSHEVRLFPDPVDEPDPPNALDEDAQRPVGDADHLLDDGRAPDLVQVLPPGLLDLCVPGRDECNQPVAPDRCVDELDRALLTDCEREHGVGKDDRVLERQNRELRRELELLDVDLLFDQLAHGAILTRISTRSALAGFFASGSTIVRIPRSYVAFARSTSISAPSAI